MKRVFFVFLIVMIHKIAFAIPVESNDDDSVIDAGSDDTIEMSDFQLDISELGEITDDLSESSKIKLAEPKYGYVNFSGFEKMPNRKGCDYQGWLEFYDGAGHYFKKRVIVDAQGNSSLMWPKKNISVDFCDDEWIGDDTPDITFGKWVKQDSFHLKAYYTDYFRGLAVAAYRLFDDIIADHGDMSHPWQRAGVVDADDNARCHPDGFPVSVYLNGEFYGVFSWQLKKHRKNMGQTKNCAEHIHLDGTLSYYFFLGDIDWTAFEIRNPKTLYCQDGSKYDGDHPKEIMDETSEFYDPENKNHLLTCKVKHYIEKMTTYISRLMEYEQEGRSDEEIRNELAEKFDVQGLIDYTIFSSITNNVDGWEKNWQWVTYDGEKWYVEPYDLDMTYGNTFFGYYVTEPEYMLYFEKPYYRFGYDRGPAIYINRYFADDLDARYAELRKKGVISVEGVMKHIKDWYERVGEDNYAKEYEKWSDSYCVQDMIIDDNWSLADDFTQYLVVPDWDEATTYFPGDMCRVDYMVWVANNEVQGIHPCPQPGYRDSFERVEDWVIRRIAMEDVLWNLDKTQLDVEDISVVSDVNEKIEAIYSINGQIQPCLNKGINIVKYSSGHTRKVFVK